MQGRFYHIMLTLIMLGITVGPTAQKAQAQAAQQPGPQVVIGITDALVNLKEGEVAQRDSSGYLISKPGDVIRYSLTAENKGDEPAFNVEIVDPIPAGTAYVIDSAMGEGMTITYSIDGGRSFVLPPVMYEVRNAQGEIEKRPAPATMYTHVKWLITQPIQPKQKTVAEMQVRVLDK